MLQGGWWVEAGTFEAKLLVILDPILQVVETCTYPIKLC